MGVKQSKVESTSTAVMSDKKLVSTDTSVDTKTIDNPDGTTVKKITTTTVEKYSDGSSSTKTKVETITQTRQIVSKGQDGKSITIDPNAEKNAPRAEVTTSEKFLQEALTSHNNFRKKHGANPLTLSRDLCKVSQAWANKIAAQGKMEHSSSGFGENCYWGSHEVTDGKDPVEYWYAEVKDFNWSKIDHQKGTGHFTQVIWKDSKELGIALARGKDGSSYVVANYSPAGNFLGQFAENVGKPK
jgi:uncharacterized protein YkwD